MLDISNKLHALVDEFVSNLSSECDSLANNVFAQAHMYVKHDSPAEATKGPRPSNRTATEVLNGLKRPSGAHVVDYLHREGKSQMEHAKPNFKDEKSRSKDNGRNLRHMKEMNPNSSSLEAIDVLKRARSVDEVSHGRGMNNMVGKGKVVQTVELLSSDHSSDDGIRPTGKFPKKVLGNHRATKVRTSSSQGRSARIDIGSPSRSLESSHVMNYNYESSPKSDGGKSPEIETSFPKLRWPEDARDPREDGGTESNKDYNANIHGSKEPRKKQITVEGDDDINLQEGDDFDEDDVERIPDEAQSDGEEPPVLPKVPVKRKLLSEARPSERRSQRGRTSSKSPQVKKHKTPQIDASVITQLEFSKRPQNSVSIPHFNWNSHASCN